MPATGDGERGMAAERLELCGRGLVVLRNINAHIRVP
jgi:hypothetical protein